jgi:hypothetical protein
VTGQGIALAGAVIERSKAMKERGADLNITQSDTQAFYARGFWAKTSTTHDNLKFCTSIRKLLQHPGNVLRTCMFAGEGPAATIYGGWARGAARWGFTMKMAYLTMTAGLCAIASWAWSGVRLHEKGEAENVRPVPSAIERTNKRDRMVRAFNVRGAVMPALFSVEILDFPHAAVTIRDHDGSILYRISPTERMTAVAKRAPQKPVVSRSGCRLRTKADRPKRQKNCLMVARVLSAPLSSPEWRMS